MRLESKSNTLINRPKFIYRPTVKLNYLKYIAIRRDALRF